MTEFEDELRRALHVKAPPAGLAERIIDRVEGRRRGAVSGHRPRVGLGRLPGLAVAAGLLLVAGLWAGGEVRDYREGVRVKEELMVGLRVAGESLRRVQKRALAPFEEIAEPANSIRTEER